MQALQIPTFAIEHDIPRETAATTIEQGVLRATAPRATDTPMEREARTAYRSEWTFVQGVRRRALQQLLHAGAGCHDRNGMSTETIAENGWVTARTCHGGLTRTVKFRTDTDARIDVTQQSPDGHYDAWHVDGAMLTVTAGDNYRSLRSVTYVVSENGTVMEFCM